MGQCTLHTVGGAFERQFQIGTGAHAGRLRPPQMAAPDQGQVEVAGLAPPGLCQPAHYPQGPTVITGTDEGACLHDAELAAVIRLALSRLAEVLGG